MQRPNFIIVGASRSGTTSLHHYLKQHPQIYIAPQKSPNYFASDILQPPWEKSIALKMSKQWISSKEKYEKLFTDVNNEKAIGEVSPVYLQATSIPKKIKNYCSNIKVIAILRNPVERAYTHFVGRKRDGLDNRKNFEEVIKEELAIPMPVDVAFGHYSGCGHYYHFLKEYYQHFSKESIKVYIFENYKDNFPQLLREIYHFLEVDDNFVTNAKITYNKTGIISNPVLRFLWTQSVSLRTALRPYLPIGVRNLASPIFSSIQKPKINQDTYRKLAHIFQEDIQKLEELIQQDLSCWKLNITD